jgi:hypothetical protein
MYLVVSFFGKAWYVEPIRTTNVSMWLAPIPARATGGPHAVSAVLAALSRYGVKFHWLPVVEQDTMTYTLPSASTNHSGAQARERLATGTV